MSFLKLNVHSERRAAGTRDLIQAEEPAPPQTVTAMNMFSKAHWLLACGHLNSSSRKPSTAVVGAAPICINRLRPPSDLRGAARRSKRRRWATATRHLFPAARRSAALASRQSRPSFQSESSSAAAELGRGIRWHVHSRRSCTKEHLKNGHEAACQGTQAHASEASLKLGDAVASPEVGRNGYGCSWKACLRR